MPDEIADEVKVRMALRIFGRRGVTTDEDGDADVRFVQEFFRRRAQAEDLLATRDDM